MNNNNNWSMFMLLTATTIIWVAIIVAICITTLANL
jgi:hypothetical protein